ncbi:MAG: MmgE/PrpD family protein [Deltaproteobacteria bacterium]|nr:MmgE/PrpD family protein [Deltaproteobacteria bacterium]
MAKISTTEVLAEFVCNLKPEKIPSATRESVKKCIADLIAASIGGYSSDSAKHIRKISQAIFSEGPAGLWFAGVSRTVAGAVFANSAAASALDLDDGHRAAGGHPGAAIIPAAFAAYEERRCDDETLIAAVVAGYEVAVRIGAARDFSRLDTLATGRWCSYGAAAAAGKIKGFKPGKLAQALAIAGVQSPGLSAAGYSAIMGNHVKEGIPWSAVTGLVALELAEQSFTGPTDILDHKDYYQAEKILSDLGAGFAIDGVYFKPYACCRWIHSALDGLERLMNDCNVAAKDIRSIRVDTFGRALLLNNYPDPSTIEAAQYSIPFCLAVLAVDGKPALLPLDNSLLVRPDIIALARKIKLAVDPAFDAVFPAKVPARVRLAARGETYETTIEDPLGDPGNPMDYRMIEEKLLGLSNKYLSPERQGDLLKCLSSTMNGSFSKLVNLLGSIKFLDPKMKRE